MPTSVSILLSGDVSGCFSNGDDRRALHSPPSSRPLGCGRTGPNREEPVPAALVREVVHGDPVDGPRAEGRRHPRRDRTRGAVAAGTNAGQTGAPTTRERACCCAAESATADEVMDATLADERLELGQG